MTISKQDWYYVFELSVAITVAASMLLYGIGKPTQFSNSIILQKTVINLTGMELMWAFYGYSKAYAIIIGIFEIAGGVLLLINKTRIAGAIILTTILLNVILQDIFYGVNQGALKAAIIYQALLLIIFYLKRKVIVFTVKFYLQQIKTTCYNSIFFLIPIAIVFAVLQEFEKVIFIPLLLLLPIVNLLFKYVFFDRIIIHNIAFVFFIGNLMFGFPLLFIPILYLKSIKNLKVIQNA